MLLAVAVLFLGLDFLAMGVVVDFGLGLDAFVDVGETDDFEGVVPSAVVEGLFGFVGDGLYFLSDVVEGLIPLEVESLEGVPVQQVTPEGFPISKFVLLPRRYVVLSDIVFLDIPGLFGFTLIFVVFCKFKGNIFDKLLQSLADLVDVLVDVPAWDGFEQILQILYNFEDVEDKFLIVVGLGDQKHKLLGVLFVFGLIDEEVEGVEDLLKGQVDVAA